MTVSEQVFRLLQSTLFTNEDVVLSDWRAVLAEMKKQTVASLPGDWLKSHPVAGADEWSAFCFLQQCRWVRVMYGQKQLLSLLEENHIPSVVIKGAAAAMAYPHPSLRTTGDVDILVKRCDFERAATLMVQNGYILSQAAEKSDYHYRYSKDKVLFELHKRLPVISEADEDLLVLFEDGIDHRGWHETDGFRFPVLPSLLNGLVLIFHINQHFRDGLGLRQIIDWMMYVHRLDEAQWDDLQTTLRRTGMERLALTVTVMCQKYLGLPPMVEDDTALPTDEMMTYILEKGNFGRKAGLGGKADAFALAATEKGGVLKRLQKGGLNQWEAAKKHKILAPFAWMYQGFRVLGILTKNKVTITEIREHQKKGLDQRKLLEALELNLDEKVVFR